MGLLDNWREKKATDTLKKTGAKKAGSVVATKEKTAGAAKTKSEPKEKKHVHTATEAKPVSTVKVAKGSTAYKILIKPLVTEKSAIEESKGKYSFMVNRVANKAEVKTAVAEIYGVKPVKVNIVNVDGRPVRFGRSMGRRSDYKKATVTLPKGSTIDIHAGV